MAVKPYMFPRHSKGKLLVPVGWNELLIRTVKEGLTRNGKRMVRLMMYINPTDEMYGVKMDQVYSFRPVICIHMEGTGSIKSWSQPFSTMPNEALDRLISFRGKRFLALIKHVQKPLIKEGGAIVDGHDNQKYYFMAEIVKAQPVGTATEDVDFNGLLETIDYDLSVWKSDGIRNLIKAFDMEFDSFGATL